MVRTDNNRNDLATELDNVPSNYGLVSCICPTHDRRQWLARSIQCFRSQDYEQRELVILDDGKDPVADIVPNHPLIRYHRIDHKLTIGGKRNLLCELAQGNFIAHWDDDDWYPSWRLSRQMAAILQTPAMICGTSDLYFIDQSSRKAFRYTCTSGRPWVAGTSLLYAKATWQKHRFLDIQVGEDSNFIWAFSKENVLDLKDPDLCIAAIHPGNTSRKEPGGVWWKTVDVEQLEQIMASSAATTPPELGKSWENLMQTNDPQTVPHSEFQIAKSADLQLTEFAAFNHGQNVPHMRQWELPWATFAAQFENTGSVLDCTINPVHLAARIAGLYPHVQYRHFNPLVNGVFQLPFGFPDDSFDRVLCLNTLEHLVQDQREQLLADLSRKLKPGGLLVLRPPEEATVHLRGDAGLQRRGQFPAVQSPTSNRPLLTPQQWIAAWLPQAE